MLPLVANAFLSAAGFTLTCTLLKKCGPQFVKAGMIGRDLHRRGKPVVPEATGVLSGTVYLIIMFLFIPCAFHQHLFGEVIFPHNEFVEYIAALLSICCMLFLGFADDALDLRWRDKLFLPTIATLPLLMVYFVNSNSTTVMVPRLLHDWIFGKESVNLGFLYYMYMGMLAVFCTNAINIYSGINGLECGQSIVIALSACVFNIMELYHPVLYKRNLFSLYFLMPFIATSAALFVFNRYPARVFVGDTFCYFAGMTFAVVAILGHFSKTMLLFFIPQTINFIFSLPQLFRLVPCPRHRLPHFNEKSGLLEMSYAGKFKEADLNKVGKLIIQLMQTLRLIDVKRFKLEGEKWIDFSNMTLLTLTLKWFGPMRESSLAHILLGVQILSSLVAFGIRFKLAGYLYEIVE